MLILSTFYYYNAIVQNHLLKIKKKFIIVYSCVIISIEGSKMQNNDEAKYTQAMYRTDVFDIE